MIYTGNLSLSLSLSLSLFYIYIYIYITINMATKNLVFITHGRRGTPSRFCCCCCCWGCLLFCFVLWVFGGIERCFFVWILNVVFYFVFSFFLFFSFFLDTFRHQQNLLSLQIRHFWLILLKFASCFFVLFFFWQKADWNQRLAK